MIKNPLSEITILFLSFFHFIEPVKADTTNKRGFYGMPTIKNNWVVRDLKRAIESLLYERTGLSSDKETVLKNHLLENDLKPEDVFRNTYLHNINPYEWLKDVLERMHLYTTANIHGLLPQNWKKQKL